MGTKKGKQRENRPYLCLVLTPFILHTVKGGSAGILKTAVEHLPPKGELGSVGGACGLFKIHWSPMEAEDEPDVLFFLLPSPSLFPIDLI